MELAQGGREQVHKQGEKRPNANADVGEPDNFFHAPGGRDGYTAELCQDLTGR